jgi:hypothetical protein
MARALTLTTEYQMTTAQKTLIDWRPMPGTRAGDGYRVNSLGEAYGPRRKLIAFNLGELPHVKDDQGKPRPLNELVARAFLGKPQGRRVIHLDGDKGNCAASNLLYAPDHDADFDFYAQLMQPANHPRHWRKTQVRHLC